MGMSDIFRENVQKRKFDKEGISDADNNYSIRYVTVCSDDCPYLQKIKPEVNICDLYYKRLELEYPNTGENKYNSTSRPVIAVCCKCLNGVIPIASELETLLFIESMKEEKK